MQIVKWEDSIRVDVRSACTNMIAYIRRPCFKIPYLIIVTLFLECFIVSAMYSSPQPPHLITDYNLLHML